jgi:hypothetical protein
MQMEPLHCQGSGDLPKGSVFSFPGADGDLPPGSRDILKRHVPVLRRGANNRAPAEAPGSLLTLL